jgi:hypothetical protein
MKIGDKIRCINNDKCQGLEKGRIYTVLDIDSLGNPGIFKLDVSKDSLFKYPLYTYYLKFRFINITEQRRIKLKRLNDV